MEIKCSMYDQLTFKPTTCIKKVLINKLFILFSLGVSPLTLKTEDVLFQKTDIIVLNCTWDMESMEDIPRHGIRWQKQIGDQFKNIAVFSFSWGSPFIVRDMQPFYSNRTELIASDTVPSAVMIIKDPLCSDQGVYQCWIEYIISYSYKRQTSRSIVAFRGN